MPDVNQIYQSEFLRAEDLGGKARRVTITAAPSEIVGSGEKAAQKIVPRFAETKKRLPLNKVNALMCASLFGPMSENWIGKQIELRPERVMYQGKMVPAIRVYPAPPAAAPPAAAAPAAPSPSPTPAAPPADAGDAWEPEPASDPNELEDDRPWDE